MLFVVVCALIITIPAFFPNSAASPVAFFAVTSIAVIGLYIAYTIPVFLRWRQGDRFEPGPWTLGKKYKWINPIAFIWVALCVVIFCLPVRPGGVPWNKAFTGRRQLRAAGDDRGDGRGHGLVPRCSAPQDVQGPGPDDRRTGRGSAAAAVAPARPHRLVI